MAKWEVLILADAKYKLYEDSKVSPAGLYQLTVYSLTGEAVKTIIYYPATEKHVDYYDISVGREIDVCLAKPVKAISRDFSDPDIGLLLLPHCCPLSVAGGGRGEPRCADLGARSC